MNRLAFVVALSVASPALAGERTKIELDTSVSLENDGCLDHSVKELGMSAKRRPNERRWDIGPQFIHPSLGKEGTVEVLLTKGDHASRVLITVGWPGGPKADADASTIEERVTSMLTKMGQICGVTHPEVTCTVTAPGQKPRPCAHTT